MLTKEKFKNQFLLHPANKQPMKLYVFVEIAKLCRSFLEKSFVSETNLVLSEDIIP